MTDTSLRFDDSTELTVGDTRVLAISDGDFFVPREFFSDPAALAAIAAPDGQRTRLPIGSFLIPGEVNVLIDAGIGPVDFLGLGDLIGGNLLPGLGRLGFAPADIDVLALSHLHPDHVGWVANSDAEPMFPNARVVVGEEDWKLFVDQELPGLLSMEPHIRAALRSLFDAGRVDLISTEVEVSPAIRAIPAPGHTPGHYVFSIFDRTERLLILGDAAYCAEHLTEADWDVISDLDPVRARRTRRELLGGLQHNDRAIGCHFQHFAASRAVTFGAG